MLAKVFEQVLEFALLGANQRSHDPKRRVDRQRQNARGDCVLCLGCDLAAAEATVARADSRIQHTQEVIDFRDRPDRTSRIITGRFLTDRNRWTQPTDQVHIGLGHLAHEVPSVIAQAFDVPALTLGVQSIERQRRLSTARDARKADQFAARQDQVDVTKIVFACPFDRDFRRRHALPLTLRCSLSNPSPFLFVKPSTMARKGIRARVANSGKGEMERVGEGKCHGLRMSHETPCYRWAALAGSAASDGSHFKRSAAHAT